MAVGHACKFCILHRSYLTPDGNLNAASPLPLLCSLRLLASLPSHPGTVGTGSLRLQMRRLRAPSLSENS